MIKAKNFGIYVEKENGEVERHHPTTSNRFYSKLRACYGKEYRVFIKYSDSNKEYNGFPTNDSGWYKNKNELIKTARAFLEK